MRHLSVLWIPDDAIAPPAIAVAFFSAGRRLIHRSDLSALSALSFLLGPAGPLPFSEITSLGLVTGVTQTLGIERTVWVARGPLPIGALAQPLLIARGTEPACFGKLISVRALTGMYSLHPGAYIIKSETLQGNRACREHQSRWQSCSWCAPGRRWSPP